MDKETKERIEKEAEAFSHRSMSDAEYVSILSPKGCYIAGATSEATVWAEQLKQKEDLIKELVVGLKNVVRNTQANTNNIELINSIESLLQKTKDKPE